jgi:beta-glucosidase
MEISERTMREVFLPSWVSAITKAGGLAVMATYPAIDGIPAHGSKELLTDLLCNELGFQGVVTSEGQGFASLIDERVVENQKQSGELAIKAGVDISIWFEDGYLEPMIENVKEGKVPITAIDRAVRRMLTLKYKLGLFENPYVDPDHALKVINCQEHQDLALQAAREGIVLLKNENNLLPLSKDIKSIAVIGPNADNGKSHIGDSYCIERDKKCSVF